MTDLDATERKWLTYAELLLKPEEEGSLLGRYFIIAYSATNDITALIAELRQARALLSKWPEVADNIVLRPGDAFGAWDDEVRAWLGLL